jgi:hypothetical protein
VDPTVEEEWAEEERGPDGTDVEEEQDVGVVEERGASIVEEWGASVEAHAKDAEEGVWWRVDTEEGARWRADTEEERASTDVVKWQG